MLVLQKTQVSIWYLDTFFFFINAKKCLGYNRIYCFFPGYFGKKSVKHLDTLSKGDIKYIDNKKNFEGTKYRRLVQAI